MGTGAVWRRKMDKIREKINAWIDGHMDDMIADIAKLVAIPSVYGAEAPGAPYGAASRQALDTMMELCSGYGLAVRNYADRLCSADAGDGERAVDILCHLDVVAAGEGWETEPFTLVEKDGCIYGRGTDDDKGPAVAALYAIRGVKESGATMKKSVRLICGTNEEMGCVDLPYYYETEQPAPGTFSPDGHFPVINTEKGHYSPSFALDLPEEGGPVKITELAAGDSTGAASNVIPSDARAYLTGLSRETAERICMPLAKKQGVQLKLTETAGVLCLHVQGCSAHASTPEEGVNSLTALLELLSVLPLSPGKTADVIRFLSGAFPHGDGFGRGLGVDQGDELSGPLTAAFTILHIKESRLFGRFDMRLPLCADEKSCGAPVKTRFGAVGLALQGELEKAHHTPADSPFVAALLRAYEENTGEKGECISMGGITYVHNVEGGVCFGAAMPGYVSNLHSANEHASIENLKMACKIFAQVILELCC